jgi:hypothetical protein
MAAAAGIQQALKKASAGGGRATGCSAGRRAAGEGAGEGDNGSRGGQRAAQRGADGREAADGYQDFEAAKGGPGVLKQDVSSAWIC